MQLLAQARSSSAPGILLSGLDPRRLGVPSTRYTGRGRVEHRGAGDRSRERATAETPTADADAPDADGGPGRRSSCGPNESV